MGVKPIRLKWIDCPSYALGRVTHVFTLGHAGFIEASIKGPCKCLLCLLHKVLLTHHYLNCLSRVHAQSRASTYLMTQSRGKWFTQSGSKMCTRTNPAIFSIHSLCAPAWHWHSLESAKEFETIWWRFMEYKALRFWSKEIARREPSWIPIRVEKTKHRDKDWVCKGQIMAKTNISPDGQTDFAAGAPGGQDGAVAYKDKSLFIFMLVWLSQSRKLYSKPAKRAISPDWTEWMNNLQKSWDNPSCLIPASGWI